MPVVNDSKLMSATGTHGMVLNLNKTSRAEDLVEPGLTGCFNLVITIVVGMTKCL